MFKYSPSARRKRYSPRPAFGRAGECFAQTPLDGRQIVGMNIPKPKADLCAVVGRRETEQTFQAAGPGECAGRYIPIPNRIIRSPGNDFKIVRTRCRNDFERCRALFLRTVFMEFSEQFWCGIVGCCCHCGHGRGRPTEKARSVPALAATAIEFPCLSPASKIWLRSKQCPPIPAAPCKTKKPSPRGAAPGLAKTMRWPLCLGLYPTAESASRQPLRVPESGRLQTTRVTSHARPYLFRGRRWANKFCEHEAARIGGDVRRRSVR